jgi:hypothetical protein
MAMADLTLTISVPEAAVPALLAAAGGQEPEAWLRDYVAARLRERALAETSNAAAATYNAAVSEAKAALDAAVAQAAADADAAVADVAVAVEAAGDAGHPARSADRDGDPDAAAQA